MRRRYKTNKKRVYKNGRYTSRTMRYKTQKRKRVGGMRRLLIGKVPAEATEAQEPEPELQPEPSYTPVSSTDVDSMDTDVAGIISKLIGGREIGIAHCEVIKKYFGIIAGNLKEDCHWYLKRPGVTNVVNTSILFAPYHTTLVTEFNSMMDDPALERKIAVEEALITTIWAGVTAVEMVADKVATIMKAQKIIAAIASSGASLVAKEGAKYLVKKDKRNPKQNRQTASQLVAQNRVDMTMSSVAEIEGKVKLLIAPFSECYIHPSSLLLKRIYVAWDVSNPVPNETLHKKVIKKMIAIQRDGNKFRRLLDGGRITIDDGNNSSCNALFNAFVAKWFEDYCHMIESKGDSGESTQQEDYITKFIGNGVKDTAAQTFALDQEFNTTLLRNSQKLLFVIRLLEERTRVEDMTFERDCERGYNPRIFMMEQQCYILYLNFHLEYPEDMIDSIWVQKYIMWYENVFAQLQHIGELWPTGSHKYFTGLKVETEHFDPTKVVHSWFTTPLKAESDVSGVWTEVGERGWDQISACIPQQNTALEVLRTATEAPEFPFHRDTGVPQISPILRYIWMLMYICNINIQKSEVDAVRTTTNQGPNTPQLEDLEGSKNSQDLNNVIQGRLPRVYPEMLHMIQLKNKIFSYNRTTFKMHLYYNTDPIIVSVIAEKGATSQAPLEAKFQDYDGNPVKFSEDMKYVLCPNFGNHKEWSQSLPSAEDIERSFQHYHLDKNQNIKFWHPEGLFILLPCNRRLIDPLTIKQAQYQMFLPKTLTLESKVLPDCHLEFCCAGLTNPLVGRSGWTPKSHIPPPPQNPIAGGPLFPEYIRKEKRSKGVLQQYDIWMKEERTNIKLCLKKMAGPPTMGEGKRLENYRGVGLGDTEIVDNNDTINFGGEVECAYVTKKSHSENFMMPLYGFSGAGDGGNEDVEIKITEMERRMFRAAERAEQEVQDDDVFPIVLKHQSLNSMELEEAKKQLRNVVASWHQNLDKRRKSNPLSKKKATWQYEKKVYELQKHIEIMEGGGSAPHVSYETLETYEITIWVKRKGCQFNVTPQSGGAERKRIQYQHGFAMIVGHNDWGFTQKIMHLLQNPHDWNILTPRLFQNMKESSEIFVVNYIQGFTIDKFPELYSLLPTARATSTLQEARVTVRKAATAAASSSAAESHAAAQPQKTFLDFEWKLYGDTGVIMNIISRLVGVTPQGEEMQDSLFNRYIQEFNIIMSVYYNLYAETKNAYGPESIIVTTLKQFGQKILYSFMYILSQDGYKYMAPLLKNNSKLVMLLTALSQLSAGLEITGLGVWDTEIPEDESTWLRNGIFRVAG